MKISTVQNYLGVVKMFSKKTEQLNILELAQMVKEGRAVKPAGRFEALSGNLVVSLSSKSLFIEKDETGKGSIYDEVFKVEIFQVHNGDTRMNQLIIVFDDDTYLAKEDVSLNEAKSTFPSARSMYNFSKGRLNKVFDADMSGTAD